MKHIDLHSHVIPETIIRAMREQPDVYNTQIEGEGHKRVFVRGKTRFELLPEFYDPQAKVESMDRKGLTISAISPGPQSFFYNLTDADLALRTARLVNEGVAQMVAQHPDRLRGMATLPMQHPDAAIVELERVVREYRFKAVEMGTAIGEEELADPKFRPVLRRMQELKVVVFAHPNTQGSGGRLDCYYLTNLIGNPLDNDCRAQVGVQWRLDEPGRRKCFLRMGAGFCRTRSAASSTGTQSVPTPRQLRNRSRCRCSSSFISMHSRTIRKQSGTFSTGSVRSGL